MTDCQKCNAALADGDKFCGSCGHPTAVADGHCLACSAPVEARDKHCYSCGASLAQKNKSLAPVWQPKDVKVEPICAICQHYRDIKMISAELPYWTGTAISQALIKIEESQVKQSVAEASRRATLVETSKKRWPHPPIMSAYCGKHEADEVFEVCEVKNRALDCPDFTLREKDPVSCKHCAHLAEGKEDPYPPQGSLTPDLYEKQLESIDAQVALEITALWATKGVPGRTVEFHDFCTLYGKARPYVNRHGECTEKFRYVPESPMFRAMRERDKKKRK